MSLTDSSKSSAASPFIVAGVVFLITGGLIPFAGSSGPGLWQILALCVCAGLGGGLLVIPFLRQEKHLQKVRLERETRMHALASGTETALKQLNDATASLHLISEQNHRQQALVTQSAEKLATAGDVALAQFNKSIEIAVTAALDRIDASCSLRQQALVEESATKLAASGDTALASLHQTVEAAVIQARANATSHLQAEADRVAVALTQRLEAEVARQAALLREPLAQAERAIAELSALEARFDTVRAAWSGQVETDTASLTALLQQAQTAFHTSVQTAQADLQVSLDAARATLVNEQAELVAAMVPVTPELVARPESEMQAVAPQRERAPAERTVEAESVPETSPMAAPVCEDASARVVPPTSDPVMEEVQQSSISDLAPVVEKPLPVNPIEFKGDVAYDMLASMMDEALSS